jgi:two-component system, NarL family, nitrate/nitrite response regulator NarL
MEPATRVAILEDQRMVRESVAELLVREGVEVVASCATPAEFLHALERAEVDVALLDLNLQRVPDAGLTVARELRERRPSVAVVMVTGTCDAELASRCAQLGISGFVDKGSAGTSAVLDVVRAAARGERLLPADVALDFSAPPTAARGPSVLDRLTSREIEVLRFVSTGADNLKIAANLNITERTVRAHVSNLYRKLGCENRAEMAVFARGLGMRPPDTRTGGGDSERH